MAVRTTRTSSTYRFGAWRFRHGIVALALLFALSSLTRSLAAQQTDWSAMLQIQPYPSPYLSDWEANPNIATLTLVNPTTSSRDVVLRYDIHNQQGALLASGRSDPQTIAAGSPTIYTSFVDIEGSSQHDPTLESEMTTTGRIPEGVYTVCVLAADAQNLVLARTCEQFTIVYPDPPMLISPADGAVVTTTSPMFQWTPLQVPTDYQLRYILQIAEVHQGQTAAAALAANIPLYDNRDVGSTVLEYPLDAQPFEQGKTYAWRVMTLDQNGYPPSTNGGMSEIQTFQYDDGSSPLPPPANSLVTLTVMNADADSGATPDPPTDTLSLAHICDNWTQSSGTPVAYALVVNSRWGFHPFGNTPAELYRDVSDTTAHRWWLYSARGKRELLVHGNCEGPWGGLEWIVSKRANDKTLGEWLISRNPNNVALPFVGDTVQFGAWAFAVKDDSLWVDPNHNFFDFFGDHSFDVKRGLNSFAVIALKQGPLWPLFQWLGYDQKAITLTGFVGFDVKRTLGIEGAGSGPTAKLSTEQTFLTLGLELPERTPLPGSPFSLIAKSMHVGIELEVGRASDFSTTGDSTGVTQESTWKIIPKITHTIELKDDIAKHIEGKRELVGELALENGSKTTETNAIQANAKRIWSTLVKTKNRVAPTRFGAAFGLSASEVPCAPPKPEAETTHEIVVTYGLDGKLVLGPVFLEDPALELHLELPNKSKEGAGSSETAKPSLDVATKLGFTKLDYGAVFGLAIKPREAAGEKKPAAPPAEGCNVVTRPRANAIGNASDTTAAYAGRNDTTSTPTTRPRSNAIGSASDTVAASSGGTDSTAAKKPKWSDKWQLQWKVAFPADISAVKAIKSLLAIIQGAVQNAFLGGSP